MDFIDIDNLCALSTASEYFFGKTDSLMGIGGGVKPKAKI